MGGAAVVLRAICQKYKRLLIGRSFSGILRGAPVLFGLHRCSGFSTCSIVSSYDLYKTQIRAVSLQVFLEISSVSPLRKEIS